MRIMSIQWCHSQATCENFFAFILIISTIDYLASRVPGHPRAFFPVSDGLRTCWDSPKPLCTKPQFWLRVPGGRLSGIIDSKNLTIRKMKKARPEHLQFLQIPGPVFLTFLFLLPFPVSFIFLTLRLIEGSDIFPYDEIFLHLISGLPVFREGLFFLSHEPGVFRIQILHLRDSFDAKFIKCLLRCFVNCDLFAVSLEELPAVTGLTVCFISRPGVGVIKDVFPKRCDSVPLTREADTLIRTEIK